MLSTLVVLLSSQEENILSPECLSITRLAMSKISRIYNRGDMAMAAATTTMMKEPRYILILISNLIAIMYD